MPKSKVLCAMLLAILALGNLLSSVVVQASPAVYYRLDPAEWARLAQQRGYRPAPSPVGGQPNQPRPAQPSQPAQPGANNDYARALQMIDLVNQERAKAGVPALKVDSTLMDVAQLKSRDMVEKGYYSHWSPTYGTVFNMLARAKVRHRGAGENLTRSSSVTQAMVGLMRSPTHRQNILMPGWTHIGLGVVPIRGGVMITQIFIAR